jgi:Skp family chaperone for outer membrane proteins
VAALNQATGYAAAPATAALPEARTIAYVNMQWLVGETALGRRYNQQLAEARKTQTPDKIQELTTQLQDKFSGALSPVLAKLAAASNIDVILDAGASGLATASPSLDVSAAAKSWLDQSTGDGGAQTPVTVPKIRHAAYINVQTAASQSVLGKKATAQIQALTAEKTKDLTAQQTALQAQQTKLNQGGAVLSVSARTQLERDIERMQRELQRAQEDAQTAVNNLTQDLQTQFTTTLTPIVNEIAAENDVQIVWSAADGGMLTADKSLDITTLAIQRLDRAHPGQ